MASKVKRDVPISAANSSNFNKCDLLTRKKYSLTVIGYLLILILLLS